MSDSDDPSGRERSERLRQAREGDVRARFELVLEHREAIYRLAYRLLGNASDAEDATAETLLRAVEHFARYDEARPLQGWLCGIARHVCARSARLRTRTVSLEGAPEVEASQHQDPQAVHRQAESGRQLRAAVAGLPVGLREVAEARLYLGLRHAEIAALLGITEATAQMRWTRARRRLEKQLREREE